MNSNDVGESDEVIRAFIAIEINHDVRMALSARQEQLKQVGAKIGWVAVENIHLTLVFLGDIFAAQIPGLKKVLDAAAGQAPCFRFEVAGLGFFGSPRSPRVIWAGIANPPESLMRLQSQLNEEIRQRGFKTEDRPFSPHLTLGRVRAGSRVGELTSAIQSAKDDRYGWVAAEQLLLMQSRLGSHGALYAKLYFSPLKGGGTNGT